MTVETSSNRISYTGSGTTGPFSFPYYFLEDNDLTVIKVTIADGTQDILDLTTDYTVSGAGEAAGGTVTLVSALSASYKLVILRDPDVLQSASYPRNDQFPAATHERVADKLTMLVQRLKDRVDRALGLSDGVTASINMSLPLPSAGKALKWNPSADALINSTYDPDTLQAAAAASAAAAAASELAAQTAETNAETAEANAAASAAAAALAADSVMWNDVAFKTSADSPITITDADAGKFFALDCSGGAITVNLPQISALTLTKPWSIGFKKTEASANAVTINRAGTDLIDGATSISIASVQGRTLIPDTDPTPDAWTSMQFGSNSSGDVVGPASATDNAIARFDSTTGKLVQNSAPIIDDSGNITTGGYTTDGTANSLYLGNQAAYQGRFYVNSADEVLRIENTSDYAAGGIKVKTNAADRFFYDTVGNSLHISAAGGLGYGTGAGGTVTQATSKSTAVTLNKPCGQITMNGAALAADTTVSFTLTNSIIASTDTISIDISNTVVDPAKYNIKAFPGAGNAIIFVRNVSAGSLSEALVLNFNLHKGANS